MRIYFTFDYELFLGEDSGTIDNSIIKPTNELIKIADRYNIKLIFFVDSGYIIKLKEYRKKYPILDADYYKITSQIKQLSNEGHDIQLHIHPHWEDSCFDGSKWIMNTERYKLNSFNEDEIMDIVGRYKKVLTDIVGNRVFAYRAGGWCIQPFDKIEKALKKHAIYLDSTIFHGGLNKSKTHYYNFSKTPNSSQWRFNSDPLLDESSGFFHEIPISSIKLNPFFFWRLVFHKLFPSNTHKQFGDGVAAKASWLYFLRLVISRSWSVVSLDGFKASFLQRAYSEYKKKSFDDFVVIAHPKGLTPYSLAKFEKFLKNTHKKESFRTFQHWK
jgi:hypothetical protein